MIKEVFEEEAKRPRVDYTVPKAEMHVHISLALSNDMFGRRVKSRRTPLEMDFLVKREKRYYKNLTEFHNTYEACRGMTSTYGELASTTQNYLERIAREGAIYAEISNSFREGDEFTRQMEAVQAGIEAARENTGIESRIVVTSLRNFGAEKAEKAVVALQKLNNPFITGFGLVGDEGVDSFADYKRALNMAWDAGLGLTPHVAEQNLQNAVDFLTTVPKEAWDISPNDPRRLRVGHGVLIHMSTDLMNEFADRQICMEMCISANKRIGLPANTKQLKPGKVLISADQSLSVTIDQPLRHYYEVAEEHPIADFMKRGIPVCLGSDNPLLMNTNIGKESSMAHKAGVTDEMDSLALTRNAITHANVDAITRSRLMSHVNAFEQTVKAGHRPDRTALGYKRAIMP